MDDDGPILDGFSAPLGASLRDGGVNFAVFSHHAEAVDVCLFDTDGTRQVRQYRLPARTGDIWHGFVPGLGAGALYGLRVHGRYEPHEGYRFNPAKLLIDPYARAFHGRFSAGDLVCGYRPDMPGGDLHLDKRDSAGAVPRCVVTQDVRVEDTRPRRRWVDTVIYEAHVRGLTIRHPDIDPALRGTYEALAAPPVIDHLKRLGITALELLPVHAKVDDAFLVKRGLVNYWGYNTIGFFAPEAGYFGPNGPAGLRETIRRLHAEGIEVILDVVYNHTAETDHLGPTLCFRGIDNLSYYRLQASDRRYYANDTGTGNTLCAEHPFVTRLILDSLRFWVEQYGVDGFRFDLMTTLGREDHGFAARGAFMNALRQDSLLAGVKLIAEPWDIGFGGYQLGHFPPGIAEWNDRFRDGVRRFWRGDADAGQDMAARLLGSAEVFDRASRPAWSSVNYAASHDGFTVTDVVTYRDRHNQANGEDNRDGHAENYTDNCGQEGPTDNVRVRARRAQRIRNLLASVFVAQGTPMLLAGDEMGNSQGGNNNAYAQDNETTWLDWEAADTDLMAFVARLTEIRLQHPVLRQRRFLHGTGTPPDVAWHAPGGGEPAWDDPALKAFVLVVRECGEAPTRMMGDDAVAIAFNAGRDAVALDLPPPDSNRKWRLELATGPTAPGRLAAESLSIFTADTDG